MYFKGDFLKTSGTCTSAYKSTVVIAFPTSQQLIWSTVRLAESNMMQRVVVPVDSPFSLLVDKNANLR